MKTPRKKTTGRDGGPMNQAAATRAARQHSEVVQATEQLHTWLRSNGVADPADPRFALTRHDIVADAEFKRLEGAAVAAFSRVRAELMGSRP